MVRGAFARPSNIRHHSIVWSSGAPRRARLVARLTPWVHRRSGKVAGEVIDQVARIILGAMDEGRLASTEDGQPDGIEPWRIDNPSVVPQVALAIDHRNV